MSLIKNFMADYCEAVYPDDYEKQDELFSKLCEGKGPSMKEMLKVVEEYNEKKSLQ